MRKNQISKANHHSKNGVIIVDDTDTVSLNADKINKITKTRHKNIENQTNFFINTSSIHQNLPNKNIHSNNSSGKLLPNNSNYSRQQSPHNIIDRGRSPYQRNSQSFSQNRYGRSNSRNNQYQNNYSRSNSNQHKFNDRSHSISRNRNYSNNRSRNSSYNGYRNYCNDRNFSQSPHRKNLRYQNSQQNYGSNTPKYQRQINQVQSTEETQPDPPPPVIDNNESTKLQLNNINCEFTDSESDTENTISINMTNVENDYEPIINEQPIYSHIYQNHCQFLFS